MPQSTEPPSTDGIEIPEVPSDLSEKLLDGLFSDAPTPEPAPTPAAKETTPRAKKKVVEEEEEDSEEEVIEEDSTEGEEDYDAPTKKEEEEEEVNPKDESAARKQAKLKGREAKELKAKLTERELEMDRVAKERDELRSRLEEVEATRIKPEDHPEYVEARDGILAEARAAARRLPGKSKVLLPQQFGKLMADYMATENASGDEIIEADAKLSGSIVDALELSTIPYAELDEDERATFQPTIDKVVDLLERTSGKTKDLQSLHAKLTDKSRTGQLSVGVRAYENTVKEFAPVLDAVGDLAEDLIEANPHAVESVVAKLAKGSPEAAKRLEKAKADVLEALIGPRALTQKEIDKLEANGTDVKAFLVERSKAHRAKQMKLAAFFVQGLMTRSVLKETLAKLSKYEGDANAEESELDALHKTRKKAAPKASDAPVRPKDRKSPLAALFGDDDED